MRFDGFDGEWEKVEFSKIFVEKSKRTSDMGKYPLYSLTVEKGVTPKTDRYERSFLVKKEDNYKIVEPQDFVYNPMNLTLGAVAKHKKDFNISVSGYYNVFSTNPGFNSDFLEMYLKSYKMILHYKAIATGSLIEKQRVHFSQFVKTKRPMPSVEEQNKIGDFLALLDRKIEKQQEKIADLEQFKKGVMQKIFSQELRFKDEDGGEFPEWRKFKLGEHAVIKGRLGWKGLKQEEYVDNGAYLVAGKHIKKGVIHWEKCDQITDFRYQESVEIALEENDIIFSKDGSLGNPALIKKLPKEATINSTMMLVRMINTVIPDYLYQILLGHDFKKLIHLKVSGSSIPHLFQADMKDFEFLAPTSLKEQEKISNFLNNLDEKIRKENERLLTLEVQKKGFMRGMFV